MRTMILTILLAVAPAAWAQHEHHHHEEMPAEMPAMDLHAREGSGTSWMPDSSPIFAHHFMAGGWMLMLHYAVAAGYDDQLGDRGSERFTAINWIMGMASHGLLGGQLTLRSMLSAEPATAGGAKQFPLLLQTGETYAGEPLHDRQHPHDLFMELAARYQHRISGDFGFELYGAPAGEPALGPTAFMHRVSATNNPLPPISHHWQDSTHITFGVLTAGVYNRLAKLEGSVFHGAEPDEDRWDFDLGPLDSWSGRLSINPTRETSFQLSYGFIKAGADEVLHRVTASGTWALPSLAVTAVWGRNIESGHGLDSALLEGQFEPDGTNAPFVRLEYVRKAGHDLVVPGDPEATYDLFQASIGMAHRFPIGPIVPLVGASVNVGLVPGSLEGQYGTRFPAGVFIFVGMQAPKMSDM